MASVESDLRNPGASPVSPAGGSGRPLEFAEDVGPVPITAGWDAEPVVLDWYGHGRPDLLISFGGGPAGRFARVYRAPEAASEALDGYDAGEDVAALDGLRCLCPIPNDRPTRFDLIAMAVDGLVLLRNEGGAQQPAFSARTAFGVPGDLGIGPGRVAQMVADDWDGDGRVDLLIGFDDMRDYWPGVGDVPPSQLIGFDQSGRHPGYDRSGRWRGRPPRGRLFWMRNVGSPGEPHFQAPEEIDTEGVGAPLGPRPAPLTVAWGRGSSCEVLLTDATGRVRVHRNFGGQRPPVLMEARALKAGGRPLYLPGDRSTVVAADLDGDGRSEVIFGRADGRVFAIRPATTPDSIRDCVPIQHHGRAMRLGGRAVVAAADLDADGDVDLVVGDASGRLHLVEDVGTGGDHRYAHPSEIEALGLPFRLEPGPEGGLEGPAGRPLGHACPTIVDWNGNGRPDLLVNGAGGEVWFFRNNGGVTQPRFDRPEPLLRGGVPLVTPPRVRPAAVAREGDELPGLIALDLQGFLCVYDRQGDREVDAPRPLVDRLGRAMRLDGGFGLAGGCNLWAGPWTAPGRIDILVGLSRRSRFVVPALTGMAADRLEDLPTVLLLADLGDGTYSPRPLRDREGNPLVVGLEGCSPSGVDWRGGGELDLLVGADDGRVFHFHRDDLRW